MTRDVYAGDQDSGAASVDMDLDRVVHIRVRAEADPDILLRVAAVLNLFNTAPQAVDLRRDAHNIVRLDIAMRHCMEFTVDKVCRKLAQLTCVLDVSWEATRKHGVEEG